MEIKYRITFGHGEQQFTEFVTVRGRSYNSCLRKATEQALRRWHDVISIEFWERS